MKKARSLAVFALLMGTSAGTLNCGRDSVSDPQSLGEANLALVVPGGTVIGSIAYTVSGPVNRAGTFDVSHSATISGTVSGLSAGAYTVNLTATASGGGTTCGGMATFSIVAHQTTPVTVHLLCHESSRAGSVLVTGDLNICPVIDGISASPSEVVVGSTLTLGSLAHDTDALPAALTYAWSASSGSLSSATAQNPTFKCTQPGSVTISLTVSDGDAAAGCADLQTVPVLCSPITSSQSAYLVPLPTGPGVVVKPILTVGDSPNLKPDGVTPYRMVGLPDGLGAFDNGDGTFTLLANHELSGANGVPRAHGQTGAFVSRWTVRKSDLAVLHGQDLIQTANWVSQVPRPLSRFCSADLPAQSALYDVASGLGYNGRLFFDGEESGNEGTPWAHALDGQSYELPKLGRMSFENVVANPATGVTTLIGEDDDTSSPGGEVYFYIGTKTNTGSPVDRAGLTNGLLYGLKVTGFPAEPTTLAGIPAGTPFTLAPLGDAAAVTGTVLEANSVAAGVTEFQRPEDGAWDPSHPEDYYFATTASFTGFSRLWRAHFTDLTQPQLGGTLTALLDGTEGQKMMDNIAIGPKGQIMIVEDVGNNAWVGRVLRYDIATDTLTPIAQHDPNRFVTGAPSFLTIDEETSGIIDASAILGAGWWLADVQAHYNAMDPELAEGGQYVAIYDPATL